MGCFSITFAVYHAVSPSQYIDKMEFTPILDIKFFEIYEAGAKKKELHFISMNEVFDMFYTYRGRMYVKDL